MSAKVYNFPPRGNPSNLTVYVLQMWTRKGHWGSLGVYMDIEDCRRDAQLAFNTMTSFVKYRIEAVQLIPMGLNGNKGA